MKVDFNDPDCFWEEILANAAANEVRTRLMYEQLMNYIHAMTGEVEEQDMKIIGAASAILDMLKDKFNAEKVNILNNR